MKEEKRAILQSISAYVPDLVTRQVTTDPHTSLAGREERIDAALLFADVSGFTAMSENLAQLGKEGAEELTNVLNDYFSTMIDLAQSYGGQVIKFGGDAITCAFTNLRIHEYTDLRMYILRACACALAMQEKMVEFRAVETRGGVFELQMKIGISAGSVLFLSLGDVQEGLEYVLAGHPLDRMAEAEHHATAGEVVVDGACIQETRFFGKNLVSPAWEELGVIVGEEREGFLLVEGLTKTVEGAKEEEANWNALSEKAVDQIVAQLIPYLPPAVYEQIVDGQRQFVGGLRRVVSLFVNFFGLDYDADPEAGQKLQQYFSAMQQIIHRYGGRLNWISTGDKGSLLHLIFGAPVAHEDNEKRAVGCALEMQRVPRSGELPFITDQQIGIASGSVFAGNVGSERRREYTLMGDVVNLSARLMQAAGVGEILMDQHTARRAEEEFICEELVPIRVKGKQRAIPVCRPVGVRGDIKIWGDGEARTWRRESPLVGREQELAQIGEIVERVGVGHGQLLVIAGERGVGKSRLLEELVVVAREKGMYGLEGDCLSYGSQSPYLPWIDFFTAFFGLKVGEEEPCEEKVPKIEQRMVKADPELKDWVPLMGQLLGLAVPDNQLTASLDAQLRKQRMFDITLTLLRHQAQRVPFFLVIFEDVHWIDSISLEMLNYVARNIADDRILLVVSHRPTIELEEWKKYDYTYRIELKDLPEEDALELVRFKLGMEKIQDTLRDLVLQNEERVNPFFVEERINLLVDRGYLVPKAEEEGYELVEDLAQVVIPDSIQALIMSRIDGLDESSKLTVKVASVIGRRFRYRPLVGIYPVEITPERLRDNLEKSIKRNLISLDRPAPEWEHIFRQATTQEVAYESLLYKHRRELHSRIGEYLEQTYADSLEEYYELLAHHYCQSGNQEKSWDYLIKAGDKAKDKYANEAAVAHYNDALELDIERDDRHLVHESLGDVYRLIGQYEKAVKSYQEALECHPPTAAQMADLNRKIGRAWVRQGRYDEAMQYLNTAQTVLGGETETPEMARIYNDMGWTTMRQGDYKEALQLCATGLDAASGLPHDETSHRVRARLHHTLGTTYWRMGDYSKAIAHFQTCIETQESIEDFDRVSESYNNLAVVYWSQSDYNLAIQYFHKSLDIHQKIGNTYGTAMCYNNLGGTYYVLGDYPRAIEHYEKSLEIRRTIGDLPGIADVYNNLGEVHHSLGNHQQALHHLQEAVELFSEIGDETALIDAYKLLAEVELELNDTEKALEYCQLSLELAQEINHLEYEGVAYRVLGQIHHVADKTEEARQHLQKSVEILSTVGNKLELGKSYYELGIALSAMGAEEGQEQLQQAVQIFKELGVEGELEKARAALKQ